MARETRPEPLSVPHILIACALVTPFLYGFGVDSPLDTFRMAGLLLVAAAALGLWASRPREWAVDGRLAAALAAPVVVAALAAVLSPAAAESLTWGVERSFAGVPVWAACAAVAWVLAGSRGGPPRSALAAATAAATATALWGLSDLLAGPQGPGAAVAGFGNADYLGPVMLAFIPLAVWGSLGARGAGRAAWLGAAAVMAAAAWAGGVVTVRVGLGLLLLVGGASLLSRAGRIPGWVSGALASLAALVWLGFGALATAGAGGRLLALAGPRVAEAGATRAIFWEMARRAFLERPLLGWGPDGVALATQRFLPVDLVVREAWRSSGSAILLRDPHNLLALILVTTGLAGLAAFAVLVATAAMRLRSLLAADDDEVRALRVAALIGLGALLFCLIAIPASVRFAALAPALFGIVLAPWRGSEAPGRAPAVARAAAGLLAVVLLLLAALGVAGDAALARARTVSSRTAAVATFGEAALLQPTRAESAYERLYAIGAGVAGGEEDAEAYAAQVDAAPIPLRYAAYRALLAQPVLDAALLGRADPAWAAAQVEAAYALSPANPDVALERAHALLAAKKASDARKALEAYERLMPGGVLDSDMVNPRYLLYRAWLARLERDAATERAMLARMQAKGSYLVPLAPPQTP